MRVFYFVIQWLGKFGACHLFENAQTSHFNQSLHLNPISIEGSVFGIGGLDTFILWVRVFWYRRLAYWISVCLFDQIILSCCTPCILHTMAHTQKVKILDVSMLPALAASTAFQLVPLNMVFTQDESYNLGWIRSLLLSVIPRCVPIFRISNCVKADRLCLFTLHMVIDGKSEIDRLGDWTTCFKCSQVGLTH